MDIISDSLLEENSRTLRLHLLLSHDLLCEYHYYLMLWQQPVLEVPSNSKSLFWRKGSLNFSTTQFNAAIFHRLKCTFNFLLKRNVYKAKRPYRISSSIQSNTLVVILHVRIRSWEINASFATISTEQYSKPPFTFLRLILSCLHESCFLKKYKDFLSEEYPLSFWGISSFSTKYAVQ